MSRPRFCVKIERTSSSSFLLGDVAMSLSEGVSANRHFVVDKFKPCDAEKTKGRRGKNFRIAAAPRTCRRESNRSNVWRRKNRVLPSIRGTSRTCLACGEDERRNRKPKVFSIACDRKGDADVIGARKHLDQDPCGTRACALPGQKMSAIQRDVSGQTVSVDRSDQARSEILLVRSAGKG
jgi:hypothetical protein